MPVHPKFADAVRAMAADNADKAVITDILDNQDRLPAFGINTPKRIAHFLSQIGHESGGFRISVENMNYTAARMMQVWPSRFPNLEIASQYAHNPEKLGNFVYANRMGNGAAASGDGFRFRGRGLLQLTGRSMYCAVKDFTSLALEQNPEIAELAPHALAIAGGAWKFDKVDQVSENATVEEYTQRINGGQTGIADRRQRFAKVKAIMGILSGCGNVSLHRLLGRVPGKPQGRSILTATVRHPRFQVPCSIKTWSRQIWSEEKSRT